MIGTTGQMRYSALREVRWNSFALSRQRCHNIDTGKLTSKRGSKMKYYNRTYPSNHETPFHKVTHRHDKSIPGCTLLPPDDRYAGVFPSAEVCAFVNSMKEKMKFFDDGERMRYNAQSHRVPVTPCDVKHPLTYAPAGFVLNTVQKPTDQAYSTTGVRL